MRVADRLRGMRRRMRARVGFGQAPGALGWYAAWSLGYQGTIPQWKFGGWFYTTHSVAQAFGAEGRGQTVLQDIPPVSRRDFGWRWREARYTNGRHAGWVYTDEEAWIELAMVVAAGGAAWATKRVIASSTGQLVQ